MLAKSGNGGGDDKKKGDDPFENFDFNRFVSGWKRTQPSNDNPKSDDLLDIIDPLKPQPPRDVPPTNSKTTGTKPKPETSPINGSEKARRDSPPTDSSRPKANGAGTSSGRTTTRRERPMRVVAPGIRPGLTRRARRIIALGLVLAVVVIGLPVLANVWTDILWYSDIGQTGVLWTGLVAQLGTFVGAGLLAFAIIMANVYAARRLGPTGPSVNLNPQNTVAALIGGSLRLLNVAFVVGAIILSLILGGAAASGWKTILFYLNAAPWTQRDPIFNQQIGFYVFDVPFFSLIQGWLIGVVLVCLLVTAAVYFLNFSLSGRVFRLERGIQAHLSVLGALFLLLVAWGYQLANNKLVYSTRGVVPGASYTDVEAQAPANTILTVVVAIAAVALLASAFVRDFRRAVTVVIVAVVLWLAGTILVGGAYPAFVQSFSVKPNELEKETRYIENTLRETKAAYNLDEVQDVPYAPTAQLTADVAQNADYIRTNARLWEYNAINRVYNQQQALLGYYTFNDVDIDRYTIDGKEQQVVLSARELNTANASFSKTWQNTHLSYTHGYGAVVSPINQVASGGLPSYLLSNVPPQGSPPFALTQPQIYYGTGAKTFSIVNTADELDYPLSSGNGGSSFAQTRYAGKHGITLDNPLVKAAFAIRNGDINILISGALKSDSRIIYRRTISERVQALAPYLDYDQDPYLVIADGKLYWIQDAYTSTNLYPNSERLALSSGEYPRFANDEINYIRNSVKVVVDAYDGSTNFYIADLTDPLAQTYHNIYPSLYRPISEMPATLRAHLRYPEDLFSIQTQVYADYHVGDAASYYNKNNLWQIATDPRSAQGAPQLFEPYYQMTRVISDAKTGAVGNDEFVLVRPFVFRGRESNMAALMMARMDGDNYGKLVTYRFPNNTNVLSPQQVYNKAQQDSVISPQLTLLNQNGSRVIFGNMLLFPVNNSFLYVLPLYIEATNSNSFPVLQRIVIATSTNIAMYPVLDSATGKQYDWLTAFVNAIPTQSAGNTPPTTGAPKTVQQLVQEAQQHYDAAQAALRNGDLATYGNEIKALKTASRPTGTTERRARAHPHP